MNRIARIEQATAIHRREAIAKLDRQTREGDAYARGVVHAVAALVVALVVMRALGF